MPAAPSFATLSDMLAFHARRTPEAPCVSFEEERVSYAELDRRCDRVAAALIADGIGAGDRVIVLSQNAPIFFELLFGCARAGAILVPLNWRLSAREIAAILADAEPALVLAADEFGALLPEGGARTLSIERDYAAWRDAAPALAPVPVDGASAVLILYTSGTTGLPKGAMLSHRNLAYMELAAADLWSFTAHSVNLIAMPLFHIGGIGYGLLALSQGGHTVLTRRTDPAGLIGILGESGATHAFFVPTVIGRLTDHVAESGTTPPRIEHIFYGAAPIGEALLRRAMTTFGASFHHVYGMTESAGTTITLPPSEHDPNGPKAPLLRSCGRPMPWIELDLVDPATGLSVTSGKTGEIRIRSDVVMLGYWRKPAETAAALTADGWLCSGDAATRDADGFVYIQDRYKDMIVSGGENIYPSEIDNVLQHHPDVAEVAVIGVAHPTWGETPRAYVVPRAGTAPTEGELIAFTRERLARYKCPTSIAFVDALPRNASGKILKRELRAAQA